MTENKNRGIVFLILGTLIFLGTLFLLFTTDLIYAKTFVFIMGGVLFVIGLLMAREMKIKRILVTIGITILVVLIILGIFYFAYKIGGNDMQDKAINCADTCKNLAGNIKEDCFQTCIWDKTHSYSWNKIIKQ